MRLASAGALVIEALGVEHAVNDQVGVVGDEVDGLRRRLGLDHRRAQDEVGADAPARRS